MVNVTKDLESKQFEVSLDEYLDIERALTLRIISAIKYKNDKLSRYKVIISK